MKILSKTLEFHGEKFAITFRALNRKDRRDLAAMGVDMPNFGQENYGKISVYVSENCILSGLDDDSPLGLETLAVTAVIEASYSPSADEAKN